MPQDPLIGHSLKEFQLIERIGRGGMAVVYRAHQPSIKRDVAVKVIQLDSEDRIEDFQSRFAQEAAVIARLEHIHILPVYDYGLEGEVAFLAMRLLRGGSIQDMVRSGPIPLDRSVDLFRQVASGLSYAHSRGIIHRDLKPSNLMLDDAGNVYVTDFGLAKIVESSREITGEDRIVGTPHYMSPEQLRGETVSPRSDVYSLGIVLYRMLVGRLPFEASSSDLVSLIYQNLEKAPPSLRNINPDISPEVEDVVMQALEKDPRNRFASADEMAHRLELAVGRISTGSFPVLSPSQTLIINRQKHLFSRFKGRQWVGAFVLIGVALLAALFFLLWPDKTKVEEIRPPVVLQGETILAGEINPTAEEIRRANNTLQSEGFIAYISCNQSSEYYATLGREMADFSRSYGLAFRTYDSDSDAYRQITEIEKARTDGAQALIICPLDPALLAPTLQAAQSGGIRLVFTSGDITGYGGVLVAGDNYLLGQKIGHYAGEFIRDNLDGQAQVLILGFPDLADIVDRARGMKEGMLELAPNAEIVAETLGGTQEFAQASITQALADGLTFNVILSINDAGSYGAITALESAGATQEDVHIFSVDAEALARQHIVNERYIRGSVAVSRTATAEGAMGAVVRLLAGSPIPARVRTEPGEVVTRNILLTQEIQSRNRPLTPQ